MSTSFILIAKIERAHGIRGAVLIRSFAQDPLDFLSYPLFDEQHHSVNIEVIGTVKDRFICQFEGMTTRTEAEKLKGMNLYTSKDELPDLDDDEFYYADLIGLKAESKEGIALGTIEAVQNFGAGDLLVLKNEKGEELIPFISDYVLDVSKSNGKVILELPSWVDTEKE